MEISFVHQYLVSCFSFSFFSLFAFFNLQVRPRLFCKLSEITFFRNPKIKSKLKFYILDLAATSINIFRNHQMRNGYFTCCDQSSTKNVVTGDKFRLIDDAINYYYCAHYNCICPYRKFIQIRGILIWGQI